MSTRKLCFSVRRSSHVTNTNPTQFAVFTNDDRESVVTFGFSDTTAYLQAARAGQITDWQAPIKPVKKPRFDIQQKIAEQQAATYSRETESRPEYSGHVS